MSDYFISAVLGLVEGLTEFLPVSSTAHLRIVEALFKLDLADPYWKMYTIVIQLGAVLCLPVYFRLRIAKFLAAFPGEGRPWHRHPFSLVMVAFVVTAVPAFLLTKIIGKNLESLYIIGTALIVGGFVMGIVDRAKAKAEAAGPAPGSPIRTWNMEEISLGQAVWIGACQILSAVFPGTSRSMSTIAGGQVAGLSRATALEFSFFVSIPTMVAATGYELLKSLLGKQAQPVRMDLHGWTVLAIGFVVSFIIAYASVAGLMAWVRRRGFIPFAVYRIAAGAAVLFWARSIR